MLGSLQHKKAVHSEFIFSNVYTLHNSPCILLDKLQLAYSELNLYFIRKFGSGYLLSFVRSHNHGCSRIVKIDIYVISFRNDGLTGFVRCEFSIMIRSNETFGGCLDITCICLMGLEL